MRPRYWKRAASSALVGPLSSTSPATTRAASCFRRGSAVYPVFLGSREAARNVGDPIAGLAVVPVVRHVALYAQRNGRNGVKGKISRFIERIERVFELVVSDSLLLHAEVIICGVREIAGGDRRGSATRPMCR